MHQLARIESFSPGLDAMSRRASLSHGLILGLVLTPPVADPALYAVWRVRTLPTSIAE